MPEAIGKDWAAGRGDITLGPELAYLTVLVRVLFGNIDTSLGDFLTPN